MKDYNFTGSDYEQSTYWWNMYFIPGRRRDEKGRDKKSQIGYSKFQGQAEAMNKWNCLKAKLVMMETNNYINDCTHIEIHLRTGTIVNKKNDPVLLTLYQTHYIIKPEYFPTFDKDVRSFLNDLYKVKADGRTLTDKKHPLVPKALVTKDLMLEKTGFRDWEELYKYGDTLKAQGFAQGAIAGYIFREMEKMKTRKGIL